MENKVTKKDKIEIFRAILKKYEINSYLNKGDFNTIISLFKSHPYWIQKEGSGVEKIKIYLNSWKDKAFLIIRKDGTSTDISFRMAVKGSPSTNLEKIKMACRQAITPTILQYKDSLNFENLYCPITNEKLTKDNCQIDHYDLTFDGLFKKWLQNKDINFLVSKLNDSLKDNILVDKFEDDKLIQDFIIFHNQNTHLRTVSIKGHSILHKNNNNI